MITEDYVSFKIAVLLKEKGFDEKSLTKYWIKNDKYKVYDEDGFINRKEEHAPGEMIFATSDLWYSNDCDENAIWAPTLQIAMKWLREVHNIHISVQPDYPNKTNYKLSWCWSVDMLHKDCFECEKHQSYINTYEEAVEAALLYTLKNLI